MKISQVLLYLGVVIMTGCNAASDADHEPEDNPAQAIVDKAISAIGGA